MYIKHKIGFSPKLIPTLFTIPALIILFSLSIWQFQRLEWKLAIIKDIETRGKIEISALPKQYDISDILYRRYKLNGEFLHNHETYIYGGSIQFKGGVGYYILTPFKLEDGRIVIVNRGWVPEKLKNPDKRPNTLIPGQVEIIGTAMASEKKGLYIHDNQPQKNLWFYVNLAEINDFTKLPIENFYLLAKETPNTLPIGRNLDSKLHNHHLTYALTWLFAGLALIVVYILYHKRN